MKKILSKILFLSTLLFFGISSVNGQNSISLKFNRTGTDAKSVAITIVDGQGQMVKGVTASMTSSHNLMPTKSSNTSRIVCPNVNGNSHPDIKLTFEIKGLPTDFKFNTVGMDIHAFNAGGAYQNNSDNTPRQFNVDVQAGKESNALKRIGILSNADIAAGVGTEDAVHKVWNVTGSDTIKSEGTVVLTLGIKSGNENKGCFFGLSEIALSLGQGGKPSPKPQPLPAETKIYTVSWKSNTSDYMSEEADGTVVTASYDVSQRIFWKFIPTEKPGCFYIQNTATQRYIGSCNKAAAAASIIKTSEKPVEYYVGATYQDNPNIIGCYYLSSTDCPDYDKEEASPLALNKDQVTGNVITWKAGPDRVGSYWALSETEDLYEARPFLPTKVIGKAAFIYTVTSPDGKALTLNGDGTLCWKEKVDSDEQTWYFVGESNRKGGYLLVNSKNDQPYCINGEKATRWVCLSNAKGYFFRPAATREDAKTNLTVEGISLLQFQMLHSKLARKNQIYDLPCGTLTDQYVEKMSITGENMTPMYYPLATTAAGYIVHEKAKKPNSWFTLYTKSKAVVAPGTKFKVDIQLNTMPLEGQEGFLYFDWDRNGVFETVEKVSLSKNMTAEVIVPAQAKTGKTRMRFRMTENGMTEADDEVIGQIFDCMLQVVSSQAPALQVSANSKSRGEVSSQVKDNKATVKATPKGNAAFICWCEGNNILSLDKEFTFTLQHDTHLTAYFSPNTQTEITGIEEHFAESSQLIKISSSQKMIQVVTSAHIEKVQVFTPDGKLVGQSDSDMIHLAGCTTGTYIVKVYTDAADKTVKVLLK